MLVIWNDRARPSRARLAVDSAVMSRPAKRIVPASGVISPVNCPTSVVLPAPFGPISACVSPALILSVTLSVATSAPNDFRRPFDLQDELAHGPAPGLASAAGSAFSGKSTLGSGGVSPAPVARISMPQMPSFISSTRTTSSGPKNSIQCSV